MLAIPWPAQIRTGFQGKGWTLGMRRHLASTLVVDSYSGQAVHLLRAANALLRRHAQDLRMESWSALQVNVDTVCPPHRHPGEQRRHAILGLGQYSGGLLHIASHNPLDLRNSIWSFPGEAEHWSDPFEGQRISLVFYECEQRHS